MSYRSKKSRLGNASKSKETKVQSVNAIVEEVIRDVNSREPENDETLHDQYNQTMDLAMDNPTVPIYTDNDDIRSNLGKRPGKESLGPLQSQPSVVDPSSEFRSSRRQSTRVKDGSVRPNYSVAPKGGQGNETEISSSHNVWMDDPLMNEPREDTTMIGSDLRPNNVGKLHSEDSPSQLRLSKRKSTWIEEDVEEPPSRGLSQGRRSNLANWTDDVEFDEMEDVEMRDSEGRRGKKGGRILPQHVWSLQPGVRFVVPVNSLDQPVRKGGHVLIKFLGDVAKNGEYCPIGELNWHKVDKVHKANIISLVRDKFVLPAREVIDKSILKLVGRRWRLYRHELKAQYKKPDKTQEEISSIVPNGVNASQWKNLVQYWFSEKCQVLSANGKEARASQSHRHTTGSKGFARMRDEFEKEHGREPSALEWFARTHMRKDGTYAESKSKEFLDMAEAMVAQRGSTSSPSKRIAIENEVFNELMYSDDEKSHRPIGYGFGANSNKLSGVGRELMKRGYMFSDDTPPETGNIFQKKQSRGDVDRKKHDYSGLDTMKEVKRLRLKMAAMSETNELMQLQIQRQSRQLKAQARQLQLQSEQMEGFQFQLQHVTSLLTKFGGMLNNPLNGPTNRVASRQGVNYPLNPQFQEASSGYSDSDSESIEWESD